MIGTLNADFPQMLDLVVTRPALPQMGKISALMLMATALFQIVIKWTANGENGLGGETAHSLVVAVNRSEVGGL